MPLIATTLRSKLLRTTPKSSRNWPSRSRPMVSWPKLFKPPNAPSHSQPDTAEIHNNLALIYGRLNRTSDAIEQYRAALKLNPDYLLAHKNLGLALSNSGNPAEAINDLEQYLKSSPNDLSVWAILVIDYDQTGQLQKAVFAARHAIQLARARQQTALADQLQAWLATKGEK